MSAHRPVAREFFAGTVNLCSLHAPYIRYSYVLLTSLPPHPAWTHSPQPTVEGKQHALSSHSSLSPSWNNQRFAFRSDRSTLLASFNFQVAHQLQGTGDKARRQIRSGCSRNPTVGPRRRPFAIQSLIPRSDNVNKNVFLILPPWEQYPGSAGRWRERGSRDTATCSLVVVESMQPVHQIRETCRLANLTRVVRKTPRDMKRLNPSALGAHWGCCS